MRETVTSDVQELPLHEDLPQCALINISLRTKILKLDFSSEVSFSAFMQLTMLSSSTASVFERLRKHHWYVNFDDGVSS